MKSVRPAFLLFLMMLIGCAHGSQKPRRVRVDQVILDKDEDGAPKPSIEKPAVSKAPSVTPEVAKAIATELLRRMALIDDTKTLVYANTVGQFVAQELVPLLKCQTTGPSASDVRIGILKSAVPASFSLPGGKIFVTTSLVQKMNSEDEFAGVLANEIATSICGKGLPPNLLQQASTGWADYLLGLSTKGLSKSDLMFSDRYALVTLYRLGYDLEPYVSFVARHETIGRHMFGAERAGVLRKNVEATPPITTTQSSRLARFRAAKATAK